MVPLNGVIGILLKPVSPYFIMLPCLPPIGHLLFTPPHTSLTVFPHRFSTSPHRFSHSSLVPQITINSAHLAVFVTLGFAPIQPINFNHALVLAPLLDTQPNTTPTAALTLKPTKFLLPAMSSSLKTHSLSPPIHPHHSHPTPFLTGIYLTHQPTTPSHHPHRPQPPRSRPRSFPLWTAPRHHPMR